MKVLITGGAGVTGTALATQLAKKGYEVRILDIEESLTPVKINHFRNLGIEVVPGDIRNKTIVKEALKDVDQVHHLATAYRKNMASKEYYWDVDIGGTQNLLDASLQENLERFVHCSTTGVYGHVTNPPANESYPYNPYDVYQKAKCEAEKLVLKYMHEKDMPGVVMRPCGIYGPTDKRLLRLFKAINENKFRMIGKGKVCYHLIYVDDLADALELAGNKKVAIGNDYIVGGNESPTLNELVEVIANALNVPVPDKSFPFVWPVMTGAWFIEKVYTLFGKEPPIFPRRVNWFIKNRAFDISKVKKELGYEPKFDLETGIKKTAEWYKKEGLL